jgi:hypothetical protein
MNTPTKTTSGLYPNTAAFRFTPEECLLIQQSLEVTLETLNPGDPSYSKVENLQLLFRVTTAGA